MFKFIRLKYPWLQKLWSLLFFSDWSWRDEGIGSNFLGCTWLCFKESELMIELSQNSPSESSKFCNFSCRSQLVMEFWCENWFHWLTKAKTSSKCVFICPGTARRRWEKIVNGIVNWFDSLFSEIRLCSQSSFPRNRQSFLIAGKQRRSLNAYHLFSIHMDSVFLTYNQELNNLSPLFC